MTPSDYITEAKYDEEFGGLIVTRPTFIHSFPMPSVLGHFIAAAINEKIQREKELPIPKIVVWKNGSSKIVMDGITWEYENDEDWLTTVHF